MKKVLVLLAFICSAFVTTFSLTSCEAEESGDLIVYISTDNDKANANRILYEINSRMANSCDRVIDGKDFLYNGSMSDNEKRAKKAFERACSEWENTEDYKTTIEVFEGSTVMLMSLNNGAQELARHKLGPQNNH